MKRVMLSITLSVILVLLLLPAAVSAEPANKPITPKDIKEMTFVHFAKPETPPGLDKKDKPEPEPESFYELTGTMISETATYYVNTSGAPDGALAEIIAAFNTWDDEVTTSDLFSYGDETSISGRKYNGQNTVSWARIAPKSTIAIATFWYYSDGNPETLDDILEFDIVFNSFLNWGIDEDGEGTTYKLTDAFDIQNIATHEVGHIVGLADLYDIDHNYLTMYGYGSIGETIKRTLADGDKAGAHYIYDIYGD